ncbi:hypothetical protein Cgig2_006214 [Carnegiea gigantea]|uniref:Uncharacterized protein n=1 Tax=Carnegiea gigantea TaxID=171969 RepID=A0A9Q1L0S6_9CARY|nr:hypothetical protein Cgig2_006214 [Carnegiea gigantea]
MGSTPKDCQPCIPYGDVEHALPAFCEGCAEMIDKWEKLIAEAGPSELDVWPYLTELSADVISRAAFGSSYGESKKQEVREIDVSLTRERRKWRQSDLLGILMDSNFGWGPRICIREKFVVTEAKMALLMILQRFLLQLSPSYAHAPMIIFFVKPQHGAQIIFTQALKTCMEFFKYLNSPVKIAQILPSPQLIVASFTVIQDLPSIMANDSYILLFGNEL